MEYLIKNKNGVLLTSMEAQLSRWYEHFSDLLQNETNEIICKSFSAAPNSARLIRINTNSPSSEEIFEAIQGLKDNKSPGMDNISAEIFKVDTETTVKLLQSVLSQIWQNQSLPEGWHNGFIIELPKKGDLSRFKVAYQRNTSQNNIQKDLPHPERYPQTGTSWI